MVRLLLTIEGKIEVYVLARHVAGGVVSQLASALARPSAPASRPTP